MLLSKKPICDPKGNQFEELLLDRSKPLKTAEYFGLLFEQPPTYEELLSGTPKLAPIFALKVHSIDLTYQMVRVEGIEPTTHWLKASCSTTELHPLKFTRHVLNGRAIIQ